MKRALNKKDNYRPIKNFARLFHILGGRHLLCVVAIAIKLVSLFALIFVAIIAIRRRSVRRCSLCTQSTHGYLPKRFNSSNSVACNIIRIGLMLSDTVTGSRGGVCLMRNAWKEDQHPSFINFISTFLFANSFRLNFVPIAPDFIFNCGGLSVAFIFVTNWDCNSVAPIFNRVQKLKTQFARFYVVITLPAKEQIDSFIQSYFKFGMVIGKPTFVPVHDLEMGFEKMVKIAHSFGVYKQERIGEKLKAERKQLVQGMNFYLKVVTSIPGIDNHDANALSQAIGSVQAIAKASKEQILENTDLSTDKAEMVSRFLRDPKFYLRTKIN